jgi:peroxiredoxin
MSSLTDSTRTLRERMREHIGDTLDGFDAVATQLGKRDFPALRPGDAAPDFALPDARGGRVALLDLRAAGRVVLVFYRGSWCPYCNLQLRAFQDALADLEAEDAALVAVSPQKPDHSLSAAQRAGLAFPVLTDAGSRVAERYGLVFRVDEDAQEVHRSVGIDLAEVNADGSWTLPAAATFAIERDGTILYAAVSGDYRWRVGPREVLAALRA